jgi:hypothetical protein
VTAVYGAGVIGADDGTEQALGAVGRRERA